MPRPPAKRARRAPPKPAPAQAQQPVAQSTIRDADDSASRAAPGYVTEENRKGDVYMSGALDWNEVDTAQNATTNATTGDSTAKEHRTPRTDRTAREIDSSKVPTTAARPATRGQPFASAFRRAGETSSKFQKISTPGFDSSMLSSFRPRPRQPSILHLMEGDDDEGSDFDSEVFLGSFDPEDESTPLNIHKRRTLPLDALPPTPSPKKPNQTNNDTSGKKRKLFAVEIPVLRQADAAPTPDPDPNPTPPSDNFSADKREEADGHSSDSDGDSIPLPEQPSGRASPEPGNATLAPPISSSVVNSPMKQPSQPSKAIRSQSRAKDKKRSQISTSALRENLLPARRRRRPQDRGANGDEFDLLSDDDDENTAVAAQRIAPDEDELSYLPLQKSRKAGRAALKSKKQEANKKIARRTDRKAGATGKGCSTEKPATSTKLSRAAKDHISYSRRDSRGKENDVYESIESASSDEVPEPKEPQWRMNEELLRQARKFAEVDQWTMEFEEVTGESSSPFR